MSLVSPVKKLVKSWDNPRYVQHFFGGQICGFSMSRKMVVLDHLTGLQTSMELAKALFQNILEKSLFEGLLQDVFNFITHGFCWFHGVQVLLFQRSSVRLLGFKPKCYTADSDAVVADICCATRLRKDVEECLAISLHP